MAMGVRDSVQLSARNTPHGPYRTCPRLRCPLTGHPPNSVGAERKNVGQPQRVCLIARRGGEETAEPLPAVRCSSSIWDWAFSKLETGHMGLKSGALPL